MVGVDAIRQPRYKRSHGSQFILGDALNFISLVNVDDFSFIHASPPCQRYSASTGRPDPRRHHDLVDRVRDLLVSTGKPYIIENVPGSPLIQSRTVRLCGTAFGLIDPSPTPKWEIHRHRLFESNIPLTGTLCYHELPALPITGNGVSRGTESRIGFDPGIDSKREAMGIDWMTRDELAEAIPPCYTEYIGWQLIDHLNKESKWQTSQTKNLALTS
jgi:DNA (cytosine-5)-methyltransferase 1